MNAAIGHGAALTGDRRPMKPPFPDDLKAAREILEKGTTANAISLGV